MTTGWKMLSETEPMSTELLTEVTGAVGDIVVVGADIEVLIKGPDVGNSAVLRPVKTVPDVSGL